MKYFEVLFAAFVLVSWNCILCHTGGVENARIDRSKRTSVSSWIFVDSGEDTDARFTRPPPTRASNVDPNPCNRKLPDDPNFNVPGRRISENKCDQYQWDLKKFIEKKKLTAECEKYIKDNNIKDVFWPTVLGGRNAEPGEFPHMGALGWPTASGGWKFQCGCTLISPRFLLTAAHCSSVSPLDTTVTNVKPEIVRLGVSNLEKWSNDTAPFDGHIKRIIVHPQYVSPRKYYDIALVEMEYDISFIDEGIRPACLWTKFDTRPLGSRAFATGWGYLDADGREKAVHLQAAEVDIIDSAQCDALLKPFWNRHFSGLQAHQLCAGVLRGGVDTCQGDSGGPLQVKIPQMKKLSYIIGVTSFGRGCARPNSPGVYTRISSFIDWIEDTVWSKDTVAQK